LLDDLLAIFLGELLVLLAARDRLLDLGDFVLRDVAALVGAILPGVEVIIRAIGAMADDGEGAVLHAANIEDLFQESLRSNGMVHGNEYICTSILGNKKTPRTQFPKNSVVRPIYRCVTETIFALVALAAALLSSSAQEPGQDLSLFIGCDLRKLTTNDVASFRAQVRARTGVELGEKWGWLALAPWLLTAYERPDTACVLVEAYPGYDVPDVSGVKVHFFDKSWNHVCSHSFPTGYRFFLNDVKVEKRLARIFHKAPDFSPPA